MTSYAARVNLDGLTLEVTAFAQPSYAPELVEDLPELCSIALRRFQQLVDRNADMFHRRDSEQQAMLDALNAGKEAQGAEVPTVIDPWGTGPDEAESPC